MSQPETSRHVTVSLTFATELDPSVILTAVTQRVEGIADNLLVGTSVHAFDLADDEPDEPAVQLVIDAEGRGGIQAAYVDQPERAAEHAKNIRGVFVELPIVDDFRAEGDAR